MIARFFGSLLILVTAALALVMVWPQLFFLEQLPYISQLISFRALSVAAAVIIILALAVLAIAFARIRKVAGALSLVLIVMAGFQLLVLNNWGWNHPVTATETEKSSDLTILSWNTLGDEPGEDTVAQLAINSDAKIIVLPESSRESTERVAELMAQAGTPMQVFHLAYDQVTVYRSTGLLIAQSLGSFRINTEAGNTEQVPSISVIGPNGMRIVGVHTTAPTPQLFESWQRDLIWLNEQCLTPGSLVIGDINATIDHLSKLGRSDGLGNCQDAGLAASAGAIGTWPTWLPAEAGIAIDRVFYGESWELASYEVITRYDSLGSDHRPIVVGLSSVTSGTP